MKKIFISIQMVILISSITLSQTEWDMGKS